MKERIQKMRDFFIVNKEHHSCRQAPGEPGLLAADFAGRHMPAVDRSTERLLFVLRQEVPVLFPEEQIVFTRTVRTIPDLFTSEETAALKSTHWIHERGDVSNINVDYTKLLYKGLLPKKRELEALRDGFLQDGQEEKAHYITLQIRIIDGILELADRYRTLAAAQGKTEIAERLARVPALPPRNFPEALQMFRILHFVMWCGGNYHNTVGRFDQYMYPYLARDLEKGLYGEEEALELLEEFFLTFNRDSDLYPGMQQGDNGQSMVLGGRCEDGSDCFNLLSRLCLIASLELKVIDPKINLRVHRDTPLEIYRLGTELTKQGLGFPQYSNDDIVIPGLTKLGYAPADACNYAVAACWEFIIPGTAMDIPNIEALSFAKAVTDAVENTLEGSASYADFYSRVRENIRIQADALCEKVQNVYLYPAPYLSLMMDGCCENGRDISLGCRYNNYGIHGTGLATAADSLAAVRKFVFEEKRVSAGQLKEALGQDFAGYDQLCALLRYEAPKFGNNDDYVDQIAVSLLSDFADALSGKKNDRGGIFRAGTGTAMYYLWHTKDLPATPDGRHQGEALGCNYSPSLFTRLNGPVSIIRSFAKPDLKETINGGPLTLELHDTMFRTEESTEKVALLVKSFMDLGGHQLQLNAVNRDTMLDAQKHPDQYRNLIVRVWGWSGYFVELDKEYQDHIIRRMELAM